MRNLILIAVVGCGAAPSTDGEVFDPGGHASLASDPSSATIANGGTRRFTITNSGDVRTGELAIVIGGDGADVFKVDTGTNCTTLAPGGTCEVEISVPLHAGALPADAMLVIGDADTSAQVDLSTDGGTSSTSLAWTPDTGSVDTAGCINAAGTPFRLFNAGSTEVSSLMIALPDANRFRILDTTCGSTLAAGASCVIDIGSTGMSPPAANSTVIAMGKLQGVAVTATATIIPYVSECLSVTPLALTFLAVVDHESVAQDVTIVNEAPTPRVLLWDFSSPAFAQSNHAACTGPIPSGQSCEVAVEFSPTQSTQVTATLSIHQAGQASLATVQLTGKGVASMAFDTNSYSFPDAAAGTVSAVKQFTLTTHAPTGELMPTMTNAAFQVAATTCSSLPANASCTVDVTFTPAAMTGTQNGTLTMLAETGDFAVLELKGKTSGFTGK